MGDDQPKQTIGAALEQAVNGTIQAAEKVICPECGKVIDMAHENAISHGILHWGTTPKDIDQIPNEEAKARFRVLIAAQEAHN